MDIIYWLAFALGQALFLLKRADLAAKSPLNGVRTKRNFFYLNWVTIIYRSAVEFVFPFYVFRHVDPNVLMAGMSWHLPFSIPQNGVFFFVLGLFSDLIMDWAAMQKSVMGIPVPSWLKENIPQLPEVTKLVSDLNGGAKP